MAQEQAGLTDRLRGIRDVGERARARGYMVTEEGDRIVLLGGGGEGSAGDVRWNARQAVVLLSCAAPLKVTDDNRAPLIAAVAALNAERAVPGFVVRAGGVYFENHVLIEPDGAISRITFDRSLDMVFHAIAQHGEALRETASGHAGS